MSRSWIAVGLAGLLAIVAIASDESRRLVGSYTADDDSGPLEAVFTPVGDGEWSVEFRFRFQGQDNLVFAGSAEGGLGVGLLEGTVFNQTGSRTFTFSGVFDEGVFHGTHAEIEDGIAFPTGTLILREPED